MTKTQGKRLVKSYHLIVEIDNADLSALKVNSGGLLSVYKRRPTVVGGSVATERLRNRRLMHLKIDPNNKMQIRKEEIIDLNYKQLSETEIKEEGEYYLYNI